MKFFSEGPENFISLRWFRVIPGNLVHIFCRPGGHSHLCPSTDVLHTATVNANGTRSTAEPPASTNTHSETVTAIHLPPALFWAKIPNDCYIFHQVYEVASSNPFLDETAALSSNEPLQSCAPELKCPWTAPTLFPKYLNLAAGYKSNKKYLHLTSFILLFYTIFVPHLNRFPLFSYPHITKHPNFRRKWKLERRFSNSNPVQQF